MSCLYYFHLFLITSLQLLSLYFVFDAKPNYGNIEFWLDVPDYVWAELHWIDMFLFLALAPLLLLGKFIKVLPYW